MAIASSETIAATKLTPCEQCRGHPLILRVWVPDKAILSAKNSTSSRYRRTLLGLDECKAKGFQRVASSGALRSNPGV